MQASATTGAFLLMRSEEIRRRVLEEWRGLPEEPIPRERCIHASDALKKLLRKLGLSERLNEQEIRSAWREIVGDFLAAHSVPVSVRDGVLVRAGHPTRRALRTRSLVETRHRPEAAGSLWCQSSARSVLPRLGKILHELFPDMNVIIIKGLKVDAAVGVTDAERDNPQRLEVDAVITPLETFAVLADDIRSHRRLSSRRSADHQAGTFTSQAPHRNTRRPSSPRCSCVSFVLSHAEVEVRKFVLPEADYVAARCCRDRNAESVL